MLRRPLNIGVLRLFKLALLFSIYEGPELEDSIWMNDLGTPGPRCTGLRPSGTLSSVRSPNWIPFLQFQTGMKKEASVVRGCRACGEGELLSKQGSRLLELSSKVPPSLSFPSLSSSRALPLRWLQRRSHKQRISSITRRAPMPRLILSHHPRLHLRRKRRYGGR